MIGYVFGLVLFAEIISRARLKKSARVIGSHNPGTANITRQMGIKWGLVVLLTGYLPVAAVVITAAALLPLWHFAGAEGLALGIAALVLMILRHRPGLLRALRGEERRALRKKKSPD